MDIRCFIAGAGEYCGLITPRDDDYIIAADGGYSALVSCGITPDIIVGDFDSLEYVPNHPNIAQSPPEKDDTDMLLAIKHGLAHGCKTFIIDGGLGGRLDHTLANIQLLRYIVQNGARGYLLGHDTCITAIRNGAIEFTSGASGYISVFSAGDEAQGVTIRGLKYPLENAVLTGEYPLGVSNEFIGEVATISVRHGTILVTWTCGIQYIDEVTL